MTEPQAPAPLRAKLILSCITLLLGWGVAELAVRLLFPNIGTTPPSIPEHLRLPWIAYDPVAGWVNKPGFEGRQVKSNQFDVAITIDANGARKGPRPAGVPVSRILVLGDSFTFGHGVNDGETFSAALGGKLETVEVINVGCVGTGHDQHLLLAKDWLAEGSGKPRPDLLVWGYSSADIPRNTVAFRRLVDPQTGLDYGKPRFVLRGGKLELTHVPTPEPGRVEEALQAHVAEREAAHGAFARFLRRSRLVRAGQDLVADKAEQMPLARAIGGAFVETSRENGVRLVIVNLPTRRWLNTRNPLNILKRRLSDSLLQELAEKHGAVVVDCTAAFLAQPDLDALFIQDGHYSPAGHAVVADVLADYLNPDGP
jgi:hypothetical protein